MKKVVVEDMGQKNGNIRLLFATEAYGMGADAPDVRRIVHFGPPSSVESKIYRFIILHVSFFYSHIYSYTI